MKLGSLFGSIPNQSIEELSSLKGRHYDLFYYNFNYVVDSFFLLSKTKNQSSNRMVTKIHTNRRFTMANIKEENKMKMEIKLIVETNEYDIDEYTVEEYFRMKIEEDGMDLKGSWVREIYNEGE